MIFDTTITPAAPRMFSEPTFVVPTDAPASWQRARSSRPEQITGLGGNAPFGLDLGTTHVTAHAIQRSAVWPTPIIDARNATKQDRPPRGVPR
jgi:hypothetical protein